MSTTALPLLDAATRGALVALLALLASAMWRERRRSAAVRVGAGLAGGLIVQVVFGAPALDQTLTPWWLALPVGVSVANSVLFWLFARALFDDAFAPRRWHGALWLGVVALGAASVRLCLPGEPLQGALWLLAAVKSWLPLVFAIAALAAAAQHWKSDLVEGRRRVRVFVVVAGALDTAAMVGARLATPRGRIDGLAAWFDVAMLLLIAGVLTWRLLRLGDLALFPPPPATASATPDGAIAAPPLDDPAAEPSPRDDPADQRVAADLQRAMDIERAYQDDALSVASLAARLGAPEYRLRRVINGRLGFRNFNAYVNSYRLSDARAVLADPARRDLPVLTIALEAGFGSIGPFNRAFKAETGLTPTEFRRQKLADS